MNNSFESFQRKLKNRQFAIDNSWRGAKKLGVDANADSPHAKNPCQWELLNENLHEADVCKFFDGYLPLWSHRKVIGPAIVFLKRAVRKLLKIFLGWYLFPIYQRQSHFNGKLLNSVSVERDILRRLENEINELQHSNQLLFEKTEALQAENQKLREMADHFWHVELDLQGKYANLQSKINDKIASVQSELGKKLSSAEQRLVKVENLPSIDDEFYHCFEEAFRGSRETIVERLRVYVPVVKERLSDWSKGTFVDVGSGRGEWLDILRDNGAVDYVGIDLNQKQNGICESYGHKTICGDCLEYLAQLPEESVDLVSGFQIIEHLCLPDLLKLLEQCHRVLKKGGMILFETPNPRNLIVGADTFYIDPTHRRPLEPRMLEFFVKWCGFQSVRCIDVNVCPGRDRVALTDQNKEQEEVFRNLNDLNQLMFGPQDYAVFAVKE